MKCDICGKEVDVEAEKKAYSYWWSNLKYWTINASIIGEANQLKGHRVCLDNVDKKIVIPERITFVYLMQDVKKKLRDREEVGVDKKED